MSLTKFKSSVPELELMQTSWKSDLDPLLDNPLSQAVILSNVTLSAGNNVISHKLGRRLQGWFIVRQKAAAVIYDLQDSNNNPQLTLLLNASAPVVVSLAVF